MAESAAVDISQIFPVLKKYWGYESLRPLQAEAMTCILERRDSIVVLPTGGGKSLCFQAPAMTMPGMAIVVTPLLSLMKDQTDALKACGIPAACLNSMQSSQERSEISRQIRENKLKLLYVAPERLTSAGFTDRLRDLKPSFFAIDEAHCISSWGHEFRPDYRKLAMLRDLFPDVGIHSFTATATNRVREDIAGQLGLRSPAVHVGNFDRPNLTYRVEQKSNKWEQVCTVIDRHKGESGIIYCISRKNVDDLSFMLQQAGYKALPYHAGMPDNERKSNQESFIREETGIIVATIAFGMGIDKSNVRYIIHAAAPKSIENYQQESGRAGRDGLPAECVLLWGPGDFAMWRRLIKNKNPRANEAAQRRISQMSRFCESENCRHRALVAYFGQEYQLENCKACDICIGDADLRIDVLTIAQKILSCIVRLGEPREPEYISQVLKGSEDDEIRKQAHHELSTFGILKENSPQVVIDWIRQLQAQEFLIASNGANALSVTDKGWQVLRSQAVPKLIKPRQVSGRRVRFKKPLESKEDQELFESLKETRRKLADERSVAADTIFGDAVLVELARKKPRSLGTLSGIDGVGESKCREFGPVFMNAIKKWCSDNKPPNPIELAAYKFFEEQKPLDEIEITLHRARSTVVRYLENFIRNENRTSAEPWVDAATFDRVRESVARVGNERLRPIFDDLGEEVDYDSIRVVMACLDNQALG